MDEHPLVTYLRLTDSNVSRFARQIGYSESYMRQIIAGRPISEDTIKKISDETGIAKHLLRAAMQTQPEDCPEPAAEVGRG